MALLLSYLLIQRAWRRYWIESELYAQRGKRSLSMAIGESQMQLSTRKEEEARM